MKGAAVEAVYSLLQQRADRRGLVNVRSIERELNELPPDAVEIAEILRQLEQAGYFWVWGEWIIFPKPVRCPRCNRWVEERLSEHMHHAHPRGVPVEWLGL